MPRLGYMIVDGLAFVLVGIGLVAVVVGYERNLPVPVEQLAAATELASTWADPETTGSIAPKNKRATTKAAPGREAKAEESSQSSTSVSKAWVDPPRR